MHAYLHTVIANMFLNTNFNRYFLADRCREENQIERPIIPIDLVNVQFARFYVALYIRLLMLCAFTFTGNELNTAV